MKELAKAPMRFADVGSGGYIGGSWNSGCASGSGRTVRPSGRLGIVKPSLESRSTISGIGVDEEDADVSIPYGQSG